MFSPHHPSSEGSRATHTDHHLQVFTMFTYFRMILFPPYFILSLNSKCCSNFKLAAISQSKSSDVILVLPTRFFFLFWGDFKDITFKKSTHMLKFALDNSVI